MDQPPPQSSPPTHSSSQSSTRRDTCRLIDANLNRAREALRTLEDLARFVLNNAALTEELKIARHALSEAASQAGWDALLLASHRDTAADTGTSISTPSEGTRRTLASVAAAAGSRAGEAMRVLEEVAKLDHPGAATLIEQTRYRVYTLGSQVILSMGVGYSKQWTLCVLITEAACTQHGWERVAELACEGGADCLQLREKHLSDGELLSRAVRLREITRVYEAACIINDRPDIALLAHADGVHVGQEDIPVLEVRRMVGAKLLVGVSTANLDQARSAARDGADVCGLGPMFPSITKPKASISGLEYLRAYLGEPGLARIPHLAISGITQENARSLAALGCRGVAVCSQVCGAEDPRRAAQGLVDALKLPV